MTAWSNGVGADLIEAMGWCLVHSVWQAAAVGLVAAFVLRGLKRSSARRGTWLRVSHSRGCWFCR